MQESANRSIGAEKEGELRPDPLRGLEEYPRLNGLYPNKFHHVFVQFDEF